MKILELSFKNLNSLYGEWHIDFTAPEFEGIFALTGPTGAGKSTILDALCLALYGATPRLGRITQRANDIMSRRTGECYAELVFQSREGRFRCRWDHRRSRRKADGALQTPEHQIAEADSGVVIESMKSRVGAVIEEKTGMDFERFTRSVLLAQGSFDSFLKADAEKKSSILEQITGTAIYTEISKRVHEKQREESEKLTLLEAETAGILLLSEDEQQALVEELEEAQKEENSQTEVLEKSSAALRWLKGIEELKTDLTALDKELVRLEKESELFAPDKIKLEKALKASAFEAEFAAIETGHSQLNNDQTSLERIRKGLPTLESAFKRQNDALEAAGKELQKNKKELKECAPRIRQARAFDQSLADLSGNILSREKNRKAASLESDRQQEVLKREKARLQEKLAEALSSDEYLKEHSRDEALVGGLAGIEEQLGTLLSQQNEILKHKKELSGYKREEKQAREAREKCLAEKKQALDIQGNVARELDKERKILTEILDGRLIREYRTEKESLLKEKSLRERIATLEEQRSALSEGEPCALCGSTHHPYAEGSVPRADEIDKEIELLSLKIERVEKQEGSLKSLDDDLRRAGETVNAFEVRSAAAEQSSINALKSLESSEAALNTLLGDFDGRKQKILEHLIPLGISELPEEQIPALLPSLKERLDLWLHHSKISFDIEKETTLMEGELKRLEGLLELHRETLEKLDIELKDLNVQRMTLSTDRWTLFEEKNPDVEEERLNSLITASEEGEKQERIILETLKADLQSARTEESSLSQRIKAQESDLTEKERVFRENLKKKGIRDEGEFLNHRLPEVELERLSRRSRELEDKNTQLNARKQDRKEKLTAEKRKELSVRSLEELEPELKNREDALKILREKNAELRHRLASHRDAEEKLNEKKSDIENQKKECRRWKNLHELIGSADGKKYRNFAQGLTFELMVSHANRQLEKMSDRYLLLRDEEDPLALNVVDNYQAGEIRSVKNLSGGESFIISLSLALGLSSMASRRVQVDSLFLDEGFGTLDEDALETALETLSGLHQDGKIIGIISHVAALKDRISTRIAVNPTSGGKSTLLGPGCKRIIESRDG